MLKVNELMCAKTWQGPAIVAVLHCESAGKDLYPVNNPLVYHILKPRDRYIHGS